MRIIKKQLAPWHLVLIIGLAAIAIPVTARVSTTAIAGVNERHEQMTGQTANDEGDAGAKHGSYSKAAVGKGVARPQDDYYDRRRQYWEKRVDSRLEYRDKYLDEQTGDKDDDADAEDNKAGKDDDEDDTVDQEHDVYERRREYWRQRLDKEW